MPLPLARRHLPRRAPAPLPLGCYSPGRLHLHPLPQLLPPPPLPAPSWPARPPPCLQGTRTCWGPACCCCWWLRDRCWTCARWAPRHQRDRPAAWQPRPPWPWRWAAGPGSASTAASTSQARPQWHAGRVGEEGTTVGHHAITSFHAGGAAADGRRKAPRGPAPCDSARRASDSQHPPPARNSRPGWALNRSATSMPAGTAALSLHAQCLQRPHSPVATSYTSQPPRPHPTDPLQPVSTHVLPPKASHGTHHIAGRVWPLRSGLRHRPAQ